MCESLLVTGNLRTTLHCPPSVHVNWTMGSMGDVVGSRQGRGVTDHIHWMMVICACPWCVSFVHVNWTMGSGRSEVVVVSPGQGLVFRWWAKWDTGVPCFHATQLAEGATQAPSA